MLTADEIQNHLILNHGFYEFNCIFCKFGNESIASLREHMAEKHSSKLMFIVSRRLNPATERMNEPGTSDETAKHEPTFVYIGRREDYSSFKFYKCLKEFNLSSLVPALTAVKANQRNSEHCDNFNYVEQFKGILPAVKHQTENRNEFITYDKYQQIFPNLYKCKLCDFTIKGLKPRNIITNEMIRHFAIEHKAKTIEFNYMHKSLESEEITENIQITLQCNFCSEKLGIQSMLSQHFSHKHPHTICCANVMKQSNQMESIEVGVASSCFQCKTCNEYLTSKQKLIQHIHNDNCLATQIFYLPCVIFVNNEFPGITNELLEESKKIDRSLTYYCYYCKTSKTNFDSVEDVQKHHDQMHMDKVLCYSIGKIVACAECKCILMTSDIVNHYKECHSKSENYAVASFTNVKRCGICDKGVGSFESHHKVEHGKLKLNPPLLYGNFNKLLTPQNSESVLKQIGFSPGCCLEQKYNSISEIVKHVNLCQRSFTCQYCHGNYKNIEEITRHQAITHEISIDDICDKFHNIKTFLELCYDMWIFYENGLALQKPSIQKGLSIDNNLTIGLMREIKIIFDAELERIL